MFASLIDPIRDWATTNGLVSPSKPVRRLFDRVQARILLSGLDAAGKTTILANHLSRDGAMDVETVVPFIGFSIERLRYGLVHFETLDLGGGRKSYKQEKRLFLTADALVWVIDSCDHERIVESAEELQLLLRHDEDEGRKNVPVLLLVNKQGLRSRNGMKNVTVTEVKSQFIECTKAFSGRSWHVEATDGITGLGLLEAFSWLQDELNTRNKHSDEREMVQVH
ncbi:ADP-ribosylation factor family-domain-containing protein [Xylariaceae sp. FL1019]|nr:ADP-ribosylation factor family-domain-containing protein [Xylariaceae sp. FL1019]